MAEEQKHADMQLAFRMEGQFVNAYIEHRGSKPFVCFVGSFSTQFADPLMRATWEKLITMAVDRFAVRESGQGMEIIGRRTVSAGGSA